VGTICVGWNTKERLLMAGVIDTTTDGRWISGGWWFRAVSTALSKEVPLTLNYGFEYGNRRVCCTMMQRWENGVCRRTGLDGRWSSNGAEGCWDIQGGDGSRMVQRQWEDKLVAILGQKREIKFWLSPHKQIS
jgi:hypothetical protein